jgi:hypothetical protein
MSVSETAPAFRHEHRHYDVVVVGGGMAGLASAVTAARLGARVALVQDRPMLGGNASAEVRVNLEGANGGAHNRFFVESGIAEDLLLENFWRNPTGSADHWNALLLELVLDTPQLDLYLDTHVRSLEKGDDGTITSVSGLTLASERTWSFAAHYFVDATGDGTIAFLARAEFMRGEESSHALGEPLAPPEPSERTLGGTMQFMCKDVGRPVEFQAPKFARKVTPEELRFSRSANVWGQAPVLGGFWWIEYGGHLDTIHDNADIKLELLAEVYGIWDYIKNNPEWRERNANLDLEWVAAVPGKRESRRVIGDYLLTENDVTKSVRFKDAVAYGGWSLDNHAHLGFMDFDRPPCTMVHVPGIYQIPLRCLYARDVPNLFLAGRDISCSHIACCSARVMMTCTSCGEAVGAAAGLAAEAKHRPREIAADDTLVAELQLRLERLGHFIPYVTLRADRAPDGTVATASSSGLLDQTEVARTMDLAKPRLLSLPLSEAMLASLSLWIRTSRGCALRWRLHAAHPDGYWIPGSVIAEGEHVCEALPQGGWVTIPIGIDAGPGYVHFAVATNEPDVEIGANDQRPLGPLSWQSWADDLAAEPIDDRRIRHWDVAEHRDHESGESSAYVFSFWRRGGHGWGGPPAPSIAFRVQPPQTPGPPMAVLEPFERPTITGVHGWASAPQQGKRYADRFVFEHAQWLELHLPEPLQVSAIELYFNSDVDRHLANLWFSHPPGVRAMSTLVADFDVETLECDGVRRQEAQIRDNHLRRCRVELGRKILGLRVTCYSTHGERYASLQDLRLRRG